MHLSLYHYFYKSHRDKIKGSDFQIQHQFIYTFLPNRSQ